MTGTKNFGDVQWDPGLNIPGWNPGRGWRMPDDRGRYITVDDPYWGHVLDNARKAYGDPNIHYDTDYQGDERHLVFGDGSRLPADGTLVYHDAGRQQNWAQNQDGTVSLLDSSGKAGPPLTPAGYGKFGDQYAPVTPTGQQVGPQQSGLPATPGGFYTDPKTGVLTPKNANGDYYTLDPAGKKTFFDRTGAPISEAQFNNAGAGRPPAGAPGGDLATDEQQSGHAAAAVKKLQDELKTHYSKLSDAEENLSQVLLEAHATTAAGKAQLNAIQQRIIEAVNNPAMDTSTAAGEKAYLMFLRSQAAAIQALLDSATLEADDKAATTKALNALYAADQPEAPAPPPNPPASNGPLPAEAPAPPPAPAPAVPVDPGLTDPAPVDPGLTDPGLTDPGLGPLMAPMTDPLTSGPMGDPMGGLGGDPMWSSMASMLPGALSSLGALGGLGAGGPLGGLGGLGGAVSPLADLASSVGSRGPDLPPNDKPALGKPETVDKPETGDTPKADGKAGAETVEKATGEKPEPEKADPPLLAAEKPPVTEPPIAAPNPDPAASANQDAGTPGPAAGGPPPPVTPPAAASSMVKLPDGSTADARTPQSAQAMRDWLAGGQVDTSYKDHGMTLPPPGTPVTNPVPPTKLHCGDVAMFKDHYEPVLSPVKGFLGGNVVPLSQVTSSPDFLGFIDPTAAAPAAAGAHPAPAAGAAPGAPASPAAPATGAPPPVPVGATPPGS